MCFCPSQPDETWVIFELEMVSLVWVSFVWKRNRDSEFKIEEMT